MSLVLLYFPVFFCIFFILFYCILLFVLTITYLQKFKRDIHCHMIRYDSRGEHVNRVSLDNGQQFNIKKNYKTDEAVAIVT